MADNGEVLINKMDHPVPLVCNQTNFQVSATPGKTKHYQTHVLEGGTATLGGDSIEMFV